MSDVEDWNPTDASNNAAPPNGAPEGMNRTALNDTIRAIMGSVARFIRAPEWAHVVKAYTVSRDSASVVRIAGLDATALFAVGTRFRLQGGGVVYGVVSAVAYSAPDTTVTCTIDAAGTVPVGTNRIDRHVAGASLPTLLWSIVTGVTSLAKQGDTALTGAVTLSAASSKLSLTRASQNLAYDFVPPVRARTQNAANQAIAAATETDLTSLTGLSFPVAPDGVIKFRVRYQVSFLKTTANGDVDLHIYVGAAGTKADGAAARIVGGSVRETRSTNEYGTCKCAEVIVTPATSAKIGLAIQASTNGVTVQGGGTVAAMLSWLEIERLYE